MELRYSTKCATNFIHLNITVLDTMAYPIFTTSSVLFIPYYKIPIFNRQWLELVRKIFTSPVVFKVPEYFTKYYYIGLGYKIFVYQGFLFIWVGLTHYTLIKLPASVKAFCKKKRIYLVGAEQQVFNSFLTRIRRVRKKDIYKGKGLLEVRTYKGFVKMKTGKKKQYN